MHEALIPVRGCFVCRRRSTDIRGRVLESGEGPKYGQVRVKWSGGATEWVAVNELGSGFRQGQSVQDKPLSMRRESLGLGRVVANQRLGSRDQVVVQLDESGETMLLPYENLVGIRDVRVRFALADTGAENHAERFRLRLLAHALENWNHLTGSLDRLAVDPLPHQIHLVHKILSSGNYNWLVADDVGLGKTIEVGLLLAALRRKGQARRVLVICPSGLVIQWQDELKFKFEIDARIYGRDFSINDPMHWRTYDCAIVSIDLAKRDGHLEKFQQSEGWDVVIFDEGHKLTRYASGERSDRYKLAETLRPMSEAFLLLSGTPHQGYKDRFAALLKLVRPDLSGRIDTLDANPELAGDIILRNRKSEVTDIDGKLLFRGQLVNRVAISPSRETMELQRLLDTYLRLGYRAGEAGGAKGRAIGFVMTVYRKLASSSIAAIEQGLRRRLERLMESKSPNGSQNPGTVPDGEEDIIEGGDDQDDLASMLGGTERHQFFADETEMLQQLIEMAAIVRQNDEKLRVFMNDVVRKVVSEGNKLLIFTEYRATQEYIGQAIESEFSDAGEVVWINGSMNLTEKIEAIRRFNDDAFFMISTEAGGEGINLHESCHVMVNYDLPWNPARIVQRIGRLYRYGQKETVIVFNLHTRDNFDNQALGLMMTRVESIARDMVAVSPEYSEGLHAEILGEILENLDFSSILRSAREINRRKTKEQINDAVEQARQVKELQDEIMNYVSSYDPTSLGATTSFTMQHVEMFVEGMLQVLGVPVIAELYGDSVKEIRLPEHLQGRFAEFGRRTVVRITTNRREAQQRPDVVLMDFETPFFRYLVEQAKSHNFDGFYTTAEAPGGIRGSLGAFRLRWQNDQGSATTEEFVLLFADQNGRVTKNPAFLPHWLASSVSPSMIAVTVDAERQQTWQRLEEAADRALGSEGTRFKHPNGLVPLAAADFLEST